MALLLAFSLLVCYELVIFNLNTVWLNVILKKANCWPQGLRFSHSEIQLSNFRIDRAKGDGLGGELQQLANKRLPHKQA